jgi:hypothetical protein
MPRTSKSGKLCTTVLLMNEMHVPGILLAYKRVDPKARTKKSSTLDLAIRYKANGVIKFLQQRLKSDKLDSEVRVTRSAMRNEKLYPIVAK